jgi:glycosyltransferase involved in cell wall biosynthesis
MIPTYNQSNYIQNTIESALAQNYPNLEIIISDDSTDDLTENLVNERYQNELLTRKISYYHNRPSLGRVNNYHKTLYEYSSGDYVLNLDGDDWLSDPNYISECVAILDNNPDVMATMARKQHYYELKNEFTDSKNFSHLKGIVSGNEYVWETILGKAEFNHLTVVYRRSEAIDNDFYTLNNTASDADSIFRLVSEHKIALIDKCVGVWRIHDKNATFTERKKTNYDELFEFEVNVYKLASHKHKKEYPYKIWMKMWKTQTVIHYLIFLLREKDKDIFRFTTYLLKKEKNLLIFLPIYIFYKKISQQGKLQ